MTLEDKLNQLLAGYSISAVLESLTSILDSNSDACMQSDVKDARSRGLAYHRVAGVVEAAAILAERETV